MKRLLSFILSVTLLLCMVPLGAIAVLAEENTDFAGGNGTAEAPYLIATKEHLDNVRNYLSSHFKMVNDIIFTEADFTEEGDYYNNGYGWIPIDTFSGTFNGCSHSIEGIKINKTKSEYAGLFSILTGEVSCLRLSNTYIQSEKLYVGTITGTNKGQILSCLVDGQIQTSDLSRVGGITGVNNGIVSQSLNAVVINAIDAHSCVGGIAGTNDGRIDNCYNVADITLQGDMDGCIGGIAGVSGSNSIQNCQIYNCYNIGNINSSAYRRGGIAGLSYVASSQCFYLEGACDKDSSTSAASALTNDYMMTASAYNGWDFDSVWTMGGGEEYLYPELHCFTLKGDVGITGDVEYNSVVSVDLSNVERIDETFAYSWYVGDKMVGSGESYIISSDDIGKSLKLEVVSSHAMNVGVLTSEEVLVSKATQPETPAIPELLSSNDNSFEISTISTQEYSVDNTNWQASGAFGDLDPNKEYTVYSRILENDLYLMGESAAVLTVTTDRRPLSGVVNISGTSRYGDILTADVSAVMPENATYSYEWKANGVVIGTESTYTITGEDIGKNLTVSVKGAGDYVGTLTSSSMTATKTTVQLPGAPAIEEMTNTSVRLVEKEGYEYSKDKIDWQDSPLFEGLSAATEYTFYQRAKETDTTFASKASNGTKAITLKNNVSAPENPVIENVTNTSVTLKKTEGYEYSLDGLTWQAMYSPA